MNDEDLQKEQATNEQISEQSKRTRSKSVSKLGEPKLDVVKEEASEASNDAENSKKANSRFFGVKSYLHHFYEHVSLKDPQQYEEYDEYRYLIAPKKKRRTLLMWRVMFWTGFILLMIGSVVLLTGYLMPRRQVIIGQQEELEFVDRSAVNFNKNLDSCKIFGLGVFAIGGSMLAAALLLPTLVGVSCFDDDHDDSAPFKVCIASEEEQLLNKRTKIPATEEVKSVQPKREQEAVITGTGLTNLR